MAPTFRRYPDTLVLVGGTRLSCKILGETDAGLRVELSSGIVIDLPSRRIANRGEPGRHE
ncbi:hypothetical protein FJY63_08910 [Candidatus Sumerlaeota bacterium]|nr:hypothetical protein [Candidatus Sumerlaeota bacterium]